MQKEDLAILKSWTPMQFAEIIKSVRNTIKSPLIGKQPVVLLALDKIYLKGDNLVVEGASGFAFTPKDIGEGAVSSTVNPRVFLPINAEGLCLTVMVHNDVKDGLLSVQSLSLIIPEKIVRLQY